MKLLHSQFMENIVNDKMLIEFVRWWVYDKVVKNVTSEHATIELERFIEQMAYVDVELRMVCIGLKVDMDTKTDRIKLLLMITEEENDDKFMQAMDQHDQELLEFLECMVGMGMNVQNVELFFEHHKKKLDYCYD